MLISIAFKILEITAPPHLCLWFFFFLFFLRTTIALLLVLYQISDRKIGTYPAKKKFAEGDIF